MYDLTTISKRYFEVKIEGISLKLLPPKLKVLRRFQKINVNDINNSIDEIIDLIRSILINNNENKNITNDFIEDNFTTDDMVGFLLSYFNWVAEVDNNPN